MVNLIDLIETEDTTMTDPGGYFGPEVNAFGVVVDNRDDATHTPETEAEYKKRKKKKEAQLDPNEGPAKKAETEESYVERVFSIASFLLEDGPSSLEGPKGLKGIEKTPNSKGVVGPISQGEREELSSFSYNEIQKGIKVEMEHTTDRNVAMSIVLDHLKENPHYYQKLRAVEGKAPYSDSMF